MRPRFSLRTLLAITTLAAVGCWWCVGPTLVAEQFIAARERGDFATMERLWTGQRRRPPRLDYVVMLSRRPSLDRRGLECQLLPQTWRDLFRGIRRIKVDYRFLIEDIDTYQISTMYPPLIVTHRGIHPDPRFNWHDRGPSPAIDPIVSK
jgi:hypothetical protein